MDQTPVLTEELKRHLAESRAANEYRSQQVKTELTKRIPQYRSYYTLGRGACWLRPAVPKV